MVNTLAIHMSFDSDNASIHVHLFAMFCLISVTELAAVTTHFVADSELIWMVDILMVVVA